MWDLWTPPRVAARPTPCPPTPPVALSIRLPPLARLSCPWQSQSRSLADPPNCPLVLVQLTGLYSVELHVCHQHCTGRPTSHPPQGGQLKRGSPSPHTHPPSAARRVSSAREQSGRVCASCGSAGLFAGVLGCWSARPPVHRTHVCSTCHAPPRCVRLLPSTPSNTIGFARVLAAGGCKRRPVSVACPYHASTSSS